MIKRTYNVPIRTVGSAVIATGDAAFDRQRERDQLANERFAAEIGERAREFDINAEFRAVEQFLNSERYDQQLAAQAMRDRNMLLARMGENAMQGQLALARDAQAANLAAMRDQQERELAWQTQGIEAAELQAQEALKAFGQMNLNPEGKRIHHQFLNAFRTLRGQRGVTAGPEQYAQLLAEFSDDLAKAGIEGYEIPEPTADDMLMKALRPMNGQQVAPGQPLPPGDYMYINGERNGVPTFEKMTVPPADDPNLTTQQKFADRSAQTPWGSYIYFDADGKPHEFVPPPPAKIEAPKPIVEPLSGTERNTIYSDAYARLYQEWSDRYNQPVTTTGPDGKPKTGPPKKPVISARDYIDKNIAAEIKRFNQAFADPDEATLNPTPVMNAITGEQTTTPQYDPTQSATMGAGDPTQQVGPGAQQPPLPPQEQPTGEPQGSGAVDDPVVFPEGMSEAAIAAFIEAAPDGAWFINPATGRPAQKLPKKK